MDELDDLIERLRERAGDPERRVDLRPDGVVTDDPDRDAATHVVELARSESDRQRARDAGGGRRAADLVDRSAELAFLLGAPAEPGLPRPANRDQLDEVQAILGVSLPKVLRRSLGEVADGGFGPGEGLLCAREIIRVTGRCRREAASGGWPASWLPVAELGDGMLACAILSDPAAPVVVVDRGALDDASLSAAPSLAAWLGEWASAPAIALPTH